MLQLNVALDSDDAPEGKIMRLMNSHVRLDDHEWKCSDSSALGAGNAPLPTAKTQNKKRKRWSGTTISRITDWLWGVFKFIYLLLTTLSVSNPKILVFLRELQIVCPTLNGSVSLFMNTCSIMLITVILFVKIAIQCKCSEGVSTGCWCRLLFILPEQMLIHPVQIKSKP